MIARYFYDWRSGEIEALYKHMFRTPIRFYAAREKVTQEFHDIEENAVVAEIMGHIEGWEAERKKAARTAAWGPYSCQLKRCRRFSGMSSQARCLWRSEKTRRHSSSFPLRK